MNNKDELNDLATKIREWYGSYNNPPPWSSVLALVCRLLKEQKEDIIKKIDHGGAHGRLKYMGEIKEEINSL